MMLTSTIAFVVMLLATKVVGIQENLFAKLDTSNLSPDQMNVVQNAATGDPTALNNIGLALQRDSAFGLKNHDLAVKFFIAAAEQGNVLATYNLGLAYVDGQGVKKSPKRALEWFQMAAKTGHQGALYNCGRLLAEGTPYVVAMVAEDGGAIYDERELINADPVTALEYFQAAYTVSTMAGLKSSETITEASRQAHAIVSDVAVFTANSMDIDTLNRLWLAGKNTLVSDETYNLWAQGLEYVKIFNDTFVKQNGAVDDVMRGYMKGAVESLGVLIEEHKSELSNLQLYLALDNIQEMIGPLAGKDDSLAALAGRYSEALALSHYCRGRFAKIETDSSCFNAAASSAISYYRRAKDYISAERVFQLGHSHREAATQWKYFSQTPRVFDPQLKSRPWWDPEQWSLTAELRAAFNKDGGKALQRQLDRMIALREGALRTGGSVAEEQQQQHSNSNSNKNSAGSASDEGLRRVFTPHIGLRADDDDVEVTGAGAWAEFGPLFDGIKWSESRCKTIPLICDTIKAHMGGELCGGPQRGRKVGDGGSGTLAEVERECGADTTVTLLRLRPGAHILPHCGTTNRRLIMHFALRGAEGVAFRVGDNSTVLEAQAIQLGQTLVTTTVPRGSSDADVHVPLLANEPVGGWVMSYGKGDGNAIVFDDSYEHEVQHRGSKDRYIILIVLRHPDNIQ